MKARMVVTIGPGASTHVGIATNPTALDFGQCDLHHIVAVK